VFWLRDKTLSDSEDLSEPDVLAQEIANDLQTAFEQFSTIAGKLKGSPSRTAPALSVPSPTGSGSSPRPPPLPGPAPNCS
jgi:hypothetical protein